MSVQILTFIIAIAGIYLYGTLISIFVDAISRKRYSVKEVQTEDRVRQRALEVIESNPKVKKIYVALRVMHLKNKDSRQSELLEQKLRTLVREKAVRQEIIHMVRAKISLL